VIGIIHAVYPTILTKDGSDYLLYIPDFKGSVKGDSLYDAMQRARALILKSKFYLEPSTLPEAIAKAVYTGHLVSPDVNMSAEKPISLEYVYIDVDLPDYK